MENFPDLDLSHSQKIMLTKIIVGLIMLVVYNNFSAL